MTVKRMRLTEEIVKRLRHGPKPLRVWDELVHELFIRVQPSPSSVKSWNVQVSRSSSLALGKHPTVTVDMARTQARANLGHVAKGELPPKLAAKRARHQARIEGRPETLDQLLTHYEVGLHKKNREPAAAVARVKRVYADLLALPLDKVTEESAAKIHAARKRAGKSDATTARDFTALHGVFTWAMVPGRRYVTTMPFVELKPDSKAGRRIVRYLKPDERERLFAALTARDREIRDARERTIAGKREQHANLAPIPTDGYADYLEPLVRLALNTACRKGELLALRWSSVDLNAGHFMIEKRQGKGSNKTDVPRPVLLNGVALEVLKRWHKQTGGHGKVFDVASPKRAWGALLKRAKIEQFRFHDLRHDTASQLMMSGANIYDVSKILGHASVKTTERYAHLSSDHMRLALGKLDAINAPAAEQPSKVVDLRSRRRG